MIPRPLLLAVALAVAAPARAQPSTPERRADPESSSADLYVSRRPPTGVAPRVPKDLAPLLEKKEAQAAARRKEAIALLEKLLRESPDGVAAQEALFKLAELYWEEARRQYVLDSGRYERQTEACRQRSERCQGPPQPPRLDLTRSERLYVTLIDKFPGFRRIDLAKYLLGFAAREGGRHDEANRWFEEVIRTHPDSRLTADAWMMIGEYHFGVKNDFATARDAYAHVLEQPQAAVYDLALFKSAWCDWKLGETARAGQRFKQVLDLAREAEQSGDAALRRRRSQLRDEALEYLIVLLSDDESVTAKDAYDFLASIGGERYSREVLSKLSDRFYAQTRYDRAVSAYQFLLSLDALHPEAPRYQIQVVECFMALDDPTKALEAAKQLADDTAASSPWGKANKDRVKTIQRAQAAAEETLRTLGKRLHDEAQRDEKARRKADPAKFSRAADVYSFYLGRFGKAAAGLEIRFLRAEILFFKLGRAETGGDEYLAVGKTKPVGAYHKDALKKAMAAFEAARPKNTSGKRERSPVDRKFAEAADLYTTLFPKDPEIVTIIFRNGQLYFDYGDYDEAVRLFGIIVEKYPEHPNAGAAGDRILEALVKAEDYENVEEWSRRLKKAKAFDTPEEQARLDRLIVESIGKSAEGYAAKEDFAKAAGFYLRAAKEFPGHPAASRSLFNAAVMLEKAKQPEKAAETYLAVHQQYPRSKEAAKSAFTAAHVFEDMAYFDKAHDTYALHAKAYAKEPDAANALFNAGVLAQALGRPREAIKHYEDYARRYRDRDDAEDVAFRVGVVYEENKEWGRAAGAYKQYAEKHRKGSHVVEAWTRAARAYLKLGREKPAAEATTDALKAWKALSRADQKKDAAFAAEARYLQGEMIFLDYQRVTLDVKPAKLGKALEKKNGLLGDAQKVFVEVVEVGDPTWATAGLFRIGQMYAQYAEELRNVPTPPGLSPDEEQVYRELVDTEVVKIEDKAVTSLEAGYKKALELRVYNQYTKQLRESLGKLAESKYPPEREARERSRVGDRPPEPQLVKDVVRE